jgi:hypothetical protein
MQHCKSLRGLDPEESFLSYSSVYPIGFQNSVDSVGSEFCISINNFRPIHKEIHKIQP